MFLLKTFHSAGREIQTGRFVPRNPTSSSSSSDTRSFNSVSSLSVRCDSKNVGNQKLSWSRVKKEPAGTGKITGMTNVRRIDFPPYWPMHPPWLTRLDFRHSRWIVREIGPGRVPETKVLRYQLLVSSFLSFSFLFYFFFSLFSLRMPHEEDITAPIVPMTSSIFLLGLKISSFDEHYALVSLSLRGDARSFARCPRIFSPRRRTF